MLPAEFAIWIILIIAIITVILVSILFAYVISRSSQANNNSSPVIVQNLPQTPITQSSSSSVPTQPQPIIVKCDCDHKHTCDTNNHHECDRGRCGDSGWLKYEKPVDGTFIRY